MTVTARHPAVSRSGTGTGSTSHSQRQENINKVNIWHVLTTMCTRNSELETDFLSVISARAMVLIDFGVCAPQNQSHHDQTSSYKSYSVRGPCGTVFAVAWSITRFPSRGSERHATGRLGVKKHSRSNLPLKSITRNAVQFDGETTFQPKFKLNHLSVQTRVVPAT